MTMTSSDRVFVAGHRGLVGQALVKKLREKGYENIITRSREELDLLDQRAVEAFFAKEKPDVVFLAAAKVGGIFANNTYRADFIYQNLQIQNHVVYSAHLFGVRRLVFLGSSCIYPRNAPQPMKESDLLTGELEITNRPYAIAKIAGLELVHSIRTQHGKDFFSVMPTNLYGPGDNFHPENSHVLPALIRRFHEAKALNAKEVVIWGTGTPKREFMYSEDCADAIVFLAENVQKGFFESSALGKSMYSHVNVGSGQEVTIRELAELIQHSVGFTGNVCFDPSKLDGTPRKLLDVSLLKSIGWVSGTKISCGIKETYESFQRNCISSL